MYNFKTKLYRSGDLQQKISLPKQPRKKGFLNFTKNPFLEHDAEIEKIDSKVNSFFNPDLIMERGLGYKKTAKSIYTIRYTFSSFLNTKEEKLFANTTAGPEK